jgi:hypothetical protein
MFSFLQLPDVDASAAFDMIAAASVFNVNTQPEISVDPFKISVTDGKNMCIGGDIRYFNCSVCERE